MRDERSSHDPATDSLPRGVAVFVDYDTVGWLTAKHCGELLDFLKQKYGEVITIRIFGQAALQQIIFQKLNGLECSFIFVRPEENSVAQALQEEALSNLTKLPQCVVIVSARDCFENLVRQIGASRRKVIYLGVHNHLGSKVARAVNEVGGDLHILHKTRRGELLVNNKRVRVQAESPPKPWASSPASSASSAPNGGIAPIRATPHTPGLAVFVDLENVSWMNPALLDRLVEYLGQTHGPVQSVTVYANPGLAAHFRQSMRGQVFHLVVVDTRKNTVDDMIHCDVLNQLTRLPSAVALLTGDGDFSHLVQTTARSGRKPIVVASYGNIAASLYRTIRQWGGILYLARPTDGKLILVPVTNIGPEQFRRQAQRVNGRTGVVCRREQTRAQGRASVRNSPPTSPNVGSSVPVRVSPSSNRIPSPRPVAPLQHYRVPTPPRFGPPEKPNHAHQPGESWWQRLWSKVKQFCGYE